MVKKSGAWDDFPCQSRYGYICEKKGNKNKDNAIIAAGTVTTTESKISYTAPDLTYTLLGVKML